MRKVVERVGTPRSFGRKAWVPLWGASVLLVGAVVLAGTAQAVPIDYGSRVGTSVRYDEIREDSPTDAPPLYGAPTIIGDLLDFNPPSFGSSSSGAAGVDVTDGTLSFDIHALQGNFIDAISIHESGDFTLTGTGGVNTMAAVQANIFIDIIEIDGHAPTQALNVIGSMAFAPSNGDWNLRDDGPGPIVSGTWTGSFSLDVNAFLAERGEPFVGGVTGARFAMDNLLMTLSELGTSATVGKKDVDVLGITVIPEPASGGLLGLGLLGLALRRSRRH